MGGINSEIKPDTSSIFLEAANFNPKNIRSTSRKLGLFTEASMRFERNLKPDITEYALSRAVDLIIDLAGGKIRDGMEDICIDKISSHEKIILNKEKLKLHLGLSIDNEKISKTLSYLDFKYDFDSNKEIWSVEVPFWRSDIEISEDLHEQVARIIGYDEIPLSYLSGEIPEWQPNKLFETKIFLQDLLVSAGLNETISYSAISEKLIKIISSIRSTRSELNVPPKALINIKFDKNQDELKHIFDEYKQTLNLIAKIDKIENFSPYKI